jgi:sigma-B regulation protein RsbU (phosphoserine phosphatase)
LVTGGVGSMLFIRRERVSTTGTRAGLDVSMMTSPAVLDSLPDGAYITDVERRILFWNGEAERITGWSRNEVVGLHCRDNLLCHVDKDGHPLCGYEHCPLHRAIVTGTSSEQPALLFARRKDGQRIPVEVTVAPIRDAGQRVIGGIEIFRDLSPTFQDLNRARLIQHGSIGIDLPDESRFRVTARYTPHDQVGGDFYRGQMLDADTFGLILADVVGHGVSAALNAMQLRLLWDDGGTLRARPGDFLAELSRRVSELTDIDAGYFATALALAYNANSGMCWLAAAGHPPPLIMRRTGDIALFEARGPGLGLLEQPVYPEAEITLQPGDHLLLFTDGALEIRDQSERELGVAGLRDLVRDINWSNSETGLTALEETLLKFSNRLSLEDDLTLIDLHLPDQPALKLWISS